MVTRLDRLARSTRDLLNTLAAVARPEAGFRSLGDTWADTTTAHARLMLTILGSLAEFERELTGARTAEDDREPYDQSRGGDRPPRKWATTKSRNLIATAPTCCMTAKSIVVGVDRLSKQECLRRITFRDLFQLA